MGRYDDTGHLRPVGRSTPLRPNAAREQAERLRPAGPGHAWEVVRFTAPWGSRTPLDVTLIEPGLVAEVAVDTAQERGAWRHPVRLVRLRQDMAPGQMPAFGEGAVPSA
ncbi:hypothetical protein [Streptomyces sp. NPDC014006]|uniref:ATP dependent DNA ligase n=1 Tax=Streptomyces sp. NPDC014006 TaxID=3364870 RepID=UPI0036F74A9E